MMPFYNQPKVPKVNGMDFISQARSGKVKQIQNLTSTGFCQSDLVAKPANPFSKAWGPVNLGEGLSFYMVYIYILYTYIKI